MDLSKQPYAHLFENMFNGFAYCRVEFDDQRHLQDFTYIFVNEAYENLTGLKDVTGKTALELMPGLKTDDPELFERIGRVMVSGKPEKFESFVISLEKWFSISLYSPEKDHFIVFVDEVSQQKEAEAKIIKLNRLYVFISQINQTIVHVTDEQTLFNRACKIALEFGKFKMAWIGTIDKQNKSIALVAGEGTDASDRALFSNMKYQNGGPQDHVMLTGTSFICNDIISDLSLTSWKPYAEGRSIRSCMVLPLVKNGEVIATFNLYSSSPHFFDTEEIALLEEASGDLSFALDIFGKEKLRLAIEKRVEESEENLKTIFENMSEGLVLLDIECRVKTFNGNAKKYLFENAGKEIVAGESIYAYMEEPRKVFFKDVISRILAGETIHYERFNDVPGHKVNWFYISVLPVMENDVIKGFCITGQDITEKKLIEQQREFDRNNMESLINNTDDLMWSVDRDFKLITFNSSFYEMIKIMSGISLERGGNVLTTGFPEEQLERFKANYRRAFAGETFTEIENHEDFWSEISFYPIYNAGEVIGTACFSRNITERRKTEENLKRSELHLKSANKDLETFIYRASHDLRGPLSSIIGLTNVSKLDVTDKKALEYINMISRATRKLDETLVGLVQSMAIKDVSQFEDEINFEALINDILDRFQFYDGFSKMKFNVEISLAKPFISSKAVLMPIVQNLIENAIKYRNTSLRDSYANITISDNANEIIAVFGDNGIGIEATVQDKVFDVYYKGTQESKGSGLGLYIVKTGVEKLNGSIRLISEPGKGSVFKVCLPRNRIFL